MMRPTLASGGVGRGLLALIAGVAAGCGDPAPGGAAAGAPPRIEARYVCDDGRQFEAIFDNRQPSRVTLRLGEGARTLPQAISASGARYADGGWVFWVKGADALLESPGATTTCHARP